jgi:flagellar hook-basal body complex protein FliE
MSGFSIDSVNGAVLKEISGISKGSSIAENQNKPESVGSSFMDTIKDSLKNMEEIQAETDSKIEKLISGEESDLAGLMISAEKASINMQLTLQIRNKLVEAYTEIMRTQV